MSHFLRQLTSFFLKSLAIVLLSLLVCNLCYSQQTTDEIIAECDSLYRYGEYDLVISKSQRELTSPTLSQTQKIELERILAFAYSVTGKLLDAQLHFANILNMHPDFTLDSIQISPKIYQVFREVEINYRKNGAKREIIPIAQIDSTLYFEFQKQILLLNQAQRRNQSIKLGILYPGIGMLALGEATKGWFFISTETILLTSSVLSTMYYKDAKTKYQSERSILKIEGRYQDYRNWKRKSEILWTATAVIHLYGISNIILRDTPIQLTTVFVDQRPTIFVKIPF